MSANYNKTITSLKTVKHDTMSLDAQKISVYPGIGDFGNRINVGTKITKTENNVSDLKNVLGGTPIASTYNTNTVGGTLDNATVTGIQYSSIHFVKGCTISSIHFSYTDNGSVRPTGYLVAEIYDINGERIDIHYSDNTFTFDNSNSIASFSFTDFELPYDYRFIRFAIVSGTSIIPDIANGINCLQFRVKPINYGSFTFDDDDCQAFNGTSTNNWLIDVTVECEIRNGGLIDRVEDLENKTLTHDTFATVQTLTTQPTNTGELNAIIFNSNKIPHNVSIEAIEIPITGNTTSEQIWLVAYNVAESGTKTLIAKSKNSIVPTSGSNAKWEFNEEIITSDNCSLAIYIAKSNSTIGETEVSVPGVHINCPHLGSGSDTIRYSSGTYSRDCYVILHTVTRTPLNDTITNIKTDAKTLSNEVDVHITDSDLHKTADDVTILASLNEEITLEDTTTQKRIDYVEENLQDFALKSKENEFTAGLVAPKVTTDTIILEGENLKDLLTSQNDIKITSPHALGDFYFSLTSYMPEGVLPLNGSEVSRVTYSDLYNYVQTIDTELQTSGKKLLLTEDEWQTIALENNGYCPYYSLGASEGMFRLPSMNGYLKATGNVDEAGNYVAEGLPDPLINILYRQDSTSSGLDSSIYGTNGAAIPVDSGGSDEWVQSSENIPDANLVISHEITNPIYGNSEHVTPETNTLFVGVWALSTFTEVGTANLAEIKEILSQCETILGDSLPLLSSRYDNNGLETSAWKLSDGSWLDGRIYSDAYNKILQRVSEGDTICLEMKESELLSSNEFPENFLIDTEGVKFRLPLFVVNERTIIKKHQEGTSWYTLYSDGWCEQGDLASSTSVTFLVPMVDADYSLTTAHIGSKGTTTYEHGAISSRTSTGFTWPVYDEFKLMYKVCGFAATIPSREEWEIDFNYYFKVSHGVDEGRINIEEKLTEFEETAYTRLDEVVEEVSKDYVVHVDKQVGELYFSFDNYCPDGVIPLDGRLVSRATYADLWQWVQEKGLVKDDALITTNDENAVSIFDEDGSIRYCQWYGSGDGSLTFRMPKINGYLGATGDNTLAGQYITEGLPNITGSFYSGGTSVDNLTGAFVAPETLSYISYGDGGGYTNQNISTNFDASTSNPIYGNSEHVTPETNTLFVGVWAITATKAAVFDMRDVEEALKSAESYLMNNVPLMSSRWDRDGLGNLGWVKADGSWVDGRTYTGAYNYCVEKLVADHEDFIDGQVAVITTDNCSKFIVDRINKRFRLPVSNGLRELVASYKEGTQWYNIYSDGWVEQGGEFYNNAIAFVTVDLLVPYKDTSYTVDKVVGIDGYYSDAANSLHYSTWGYTTASFTTRTYSSAGLNRFRWFAKGYGDVLSVSSPLRTSHLYWKLAHEFYAPAQAEIQEKLNLIDNLATKVDINLPTLSSRWDSDFAENIGWVKSEGLWLNGNTYKDAYNLMVSRIGVNDKFVAAAEGTELTDENADKFLIDTTAVKFRLPLINGERVLVKKYKETGTYGYNSYEIYSDGYCEQHYQYFPDASSGTLSLLYPFKTTNYNVTLAQSDIANNTDTGGWDLATSISGESTKTETSIRLSVTSADTNVYLHMTGYVDLLSVIDYNCNMYLFFKLADEVPSTIVDTQQIIDDLHEEAINFKNECASTMTQTFAQGDFVIETYRDGVNWYRLYQSGWIEQGGKGGDATTTYTVTLHKEMEDTNYHVNLTSCDITQANYNIVCNNKSTSSFEIYGNGTGATAAAKQWEVKGFVKQETSDSEG